VPSDLADLPIAEAAQEILDVERSAPLQGQFDIELGDGFADPALRAQFARREISGPIGLYRLADVTLDASLMLLLRGRRRITETRCHVTDAEYADTLVKPLDATPHEATDHYIICCNRTWHDYYHWLTQTVPAIDWSLQTEFHRNPTLVLWPLHQRQEETLALLGCQDLARLTLEISDTHHFPSAEFSDFLRAETPYMVSHAAMTTFRRLSNRVAWRRGDAEAIYVARNDTRNWPMANEADLIALLERQGVRIVVPGALTFEDQIATFRAARLVIGVHGPGLSNIVFCQPGASVYEMLPHHFANPAINRLAQAAGLNYWADVFVGAGEGDPNDSLWRVDLTSVAARLDAIRARLAANPRAEGAMNFLKRTQVAHPDELDAPARAPISAPPTEVPPERHEAPPRGMLARIGDRAARLLVRRGD